MSNITPHPTSEFPKPNPGPGPGTPGWDPMYRAVYNATPGSFGDAQNNFLTSIGLRERLDPSEASSRVRSTWNATPRSFTVRPNTLTMGAALISPRGEPGKTVRSVWNATPGSFGPTQNSALMAVALLTGVDSSRAGSIVRTVWNRTPSSYTPDQNASEMMTALLAEDTTQGRANQAYSWLIRNLP